jgi:hypothetical protein
VLLQQLQNKLISFAFFWFGLWCVVGSLLGARINRALLHNQVDWISSLQRELLRSAHAHMNTMAIIIALVGLSVPKLARSSKLGLLTKLSILFPVSTIFFGVGIVGEAFYPTTIHGYSLYTIPSALGGCTFIFSCITWSALFWTRKS